MIELQEISSFKHTIDAISSFISEGNFRFSEKGISLRAVDPSQIVLVDCFIDKKAFRQYDLEPTYVGVDVVEMARMLSRSLPTDRLLMRVGDSEITLEFSGDFSRSFHLPLIDVSDSEKEMKLPTQHFDAKVEVNARLLKEALKDALIFGSSVVLKVENNQFGLEAKGSQGMLKTIASVEKPVSVKATGNAVSKYSLNFLANVVKEADNDGMILLEFKSDAPLRITYMIGPSRMQYYLAHMIL